MNRTYHNWFAMLVLTLVAAFAATSCKESEEAGEYDNWQSRNEHFIDSIASVARANRDGSWTIFRSFTLPADYPMNGESKNYIYVQKKENGEGTEKPLYADSVRVHYEGRLIPSANHPSGSVFDKSYSSSEFNPQTDVPSLFCVNTTVVGFATALMNMVEGDRWKIYVPYQIGYGSQSDKAAVPAYSTLIFDMQLAKIYKYKIETDTSWWTKKRD